MMTIVAVAILFGLVYLLAYLTTTAIALFGS